jgi:uncharacterized BrkB/YihY/UPF0761 family membrane protein
MKTMGTVLIAPLIMALGMVVSVLINIDHAGYGVLQWCLAIVGVLLVGLIVCTCLNVAIFAPVYWFLGRLQSKKTKIEIKRGNKARPLP